MAEGELRSAARVLTLLNPRRIYHRAELVGADRIPESGGCLIVGNHGRLDFDSFILMRLVLRERGRLPRMMADHMWFKLPVLDRVFAAAGAVDGTRVNASRVLEHGGLVLTYPGGVREIMGSRFGTEHIDWEGRRGFAHVAVETGVPVVPIVGIGVNSGHIFISSGRLLGRVVYQWLLRLGPDYAEYRDPLTIGVLPVPLPFGVAVSLPLPCKLTYFVGEPVYPPRVNGGGEPVPAADVERFAQQVIDAMWDLMRRHGRVDTDGRSCDHN